MFMGLHGKDEMGTNPSVKSTEHLSTIPFLVDIPIR
ncbi:hypothetical protein A2U01_0054439, partial [Trifolium medium]|nr:hypothetical protein [Trifolium medium]